MKLRFFHKLLALGLALAVLGVSTLTFFMTTEDVLVRGLGDEALERALAAVEELEPSDLGTVFEGNTEPGENWVRLVSRLADIQARLGPAGVENVYVLAPQGEALFVVGDPTGDDPPFMVQDTVYVELKAQVLASGTAASTPNPYTDEYGTWISGYAPITRGGRSRRSDPGSGPSLGRPSIGFQHSSAHARGQPFARPPARSSGERRLLATAHAARAEDHGQSPPRSRG